MTGQPKQSSTVVEGIEMIELAAIAIAIVVVLLSIGVQCQSKTVDYRNKVVDKEGYYN
jgi:uncharacterized protein YoxC